MDSHPVRPVRRAPRGIARFGCAALLAAVPVNQQATIERERREFADWLESAELSPRRAVGLFPLAGGLRLGPAEADIPLEGVPDSRVEERNGRVVLHGPNGTQSLARSRALSLGGWKLLVGGMPGRSVLTVFAAALRTGRPTSWFPYDSTQLHVVALRPAERREVRRLLAPDGVEVEAQEAGSVQFQLAGRRHLLRVFRMPGASSEETELEIYFRDASNGKGTYPSGRFVALVPRPGGGYLLDFNRARNPFCAYNTVYPCPAPWRDNALPFALRAGERYEGGGLDQPTER